ncbi:MAG: hypothetical protein COT00_03705 [Candidatus Omnitrophica bacterium CG07_land_8_20_14_0_80_50_8]|nr:MAG: hypothetical protein AUJ71_01530 [Candidatus Omnitrophica bacterium CG1_02_49_16]PIU40060.1 MAG: hypothetical protein COT00_03705 [Candidatus Omnitrophica bacterium CG07_land_8_20_14_0_80_50_8]
MRYWDRILNLVRSFLVLALVLQVFSAFAASSEASGKQSYLVKCAKCHKLYAPANYTDEQWESWMAKMRQKAHLTPEEYEQISVYCASLRDKKQVKAA